AVIGQGTSLLLFPQLVGAKYPSISLTEPDRKPVSAEREQALFQDFFRAYERGEEALLQDDFLYMLQNHTVGKNLLNEGEKSRQLGLAVGVMRSFVFIYLKYPDLMALESEYKLRDMKKELNIVFNRIRKIVELVDAYGLEKLESRSDLYTEKLKSRSFQTPLSVLAPKKAEPEEGPFIPRLGRLLEINGVKGIWMAGLMEYDGLMSLLSLLKEHQDVGFVIVDDVPGTTQLSKVMELARSIYRKKIAIVLTPSGRACSGGATLLYGASQTVVLALEGEDVKMKKRIGVHASYFDNLGLEIRQLPLSHHFVQEHLKFYMDVGLSEEEAVAHYLFETLSASHTGMYYLSEEEIEQKGYGKIVRIPAEMPLDEAMGKYVLPVIDRLHPSQPPGASGESQIELDGKTQR
ncbi:MAG: hypothetical protein MI784_13420, partial [Cytophagales bacterium]|nr:hypothetical protein [Cytophagales bacterium]